jgi:hypothetical protein
MDKNYFIFQENGLFGAKDQAGDVVIKPQYTEMNPFSCGLSLVRDDKYRYTYVNPQNKPLFPFGLYTWCDNAFRCGFARVMEYHFLLDEKKWGIKQAEIDFKDVDPFQNVDAGEVPEVSLDVEKPKKRGRKPKAA